MYVKNFCASQLNSETIGTRQNLQVSFPKENSKFLTSSVAKALDPPSAHFVSLAGGTKC